jgi:GNAT superfamily N-acetyltransferase
MLHVRPVTTHRERAIFLSFPWKIYRNDPLWVPPLLSEKAKTIDPQRGAFFKNGYAELFIAWRDGKPVGTIAAAEDTAASRYKGYGECMIGFFECVRDYYVAEALFECAQSWALAHGLIALYGPYNLDIEDSRGVLIDGWDHPPALLCGHNPPYYAEFYERFGLHKWNEDGLAYCIDLDLNKPEIQRLMKLAEKIRRRKEITVRAADFRQVDREIEIIQELSNRSLAHLPGFVPYTFEGVAAVIRPLVSIADPELALFAEVDGSPAGFFPGVPNINEVLIHLNGLRRPWDYLRLLRWMRYKPKSISIKTVVVPPEYWDTGVGVLLFDELARRAARRGYTWADLSVTGEENTDTWPLAHHMGAKIYKRYRMYKKQLASGD